MAIEEVGPGSIGSSYGQRTTNQPRQMSSAGILKPDYDGFKEEGMVLSSDEITAIRSFITTSGVQVAPQFLGAYGGVTFDAGVGLVMPTMLVVINAATDETAALEISSAGANAFSTTIDGNSLVGEVMVLTTGAYNITSVHIGHADGSEMPLSADSTITTDEMVRFDFDDADDVSTVRINFSPPRSSGRLIDVTAVGQQRAA